MGRIVRPYERALRARDALLKSNAPRSRELAAYDQQLIEYGEILGRLRAQVAEMITPLAAAACARISGAREVLRVRFVASVRGNLAEELEFTKRRNAIATNARRTAS